MAASFIAVLQNIIDPLPGCEIVIFVSSAVDKNLSSFGFQSSSVKKYQVVDVHGLQALKKSISNKFDGFDAVFTVFGPLYLPKKIPNHIVGFAQLWILYPDNEVSRSSSLKNRILLRLKFTAYWFFFRWSAARLVVELQHVKDRLVSFKSYPADRINVVNNCVSSLYFENSKWATISDLPAQDEGVIKIGYISRAYPHKNINFLLQVALEIEELNSIKVKFFVTLNEAEWMGLNYEFRSTIINVGPLSVAQCPTFYQAMNAVIFTSFLECFSATPIEALTMKRPLFASDRRFVRDCCAEHAVYFDPENAVQTAKAIHDWYTEIPEDERVRRVEAAYQHVLTLPNSQDRARGYIEIIKKQLEL